MPHQSGDEHEPGPREFADQAAFDAAIREALNDDPDTGFFSPTDDPEWLDIGYSGMDETEAVAAAERKGVAEIRVFPLPFRSVYRKDYKRERLNLAIVGGRVIRAGFF
jgi:hypothetical protein